MEKPGFFTATKEKIYITAVFIVLRFSLGYLHRFQVAAQLPFFVNMILTAMDFIVSLPMKLVFATQVLRKFLVSELVLMLLFAAMIAYWYIFACILWYAYESLNKQDAETRGQHVGDHSSIVEEKKEMP